MPSPRCGFLHALPLAALAAATAAPLLASPARSPETAPAVDRVREFFAALESMDIPRFLAVWADDGVQEMPYAPGAFPRRLSGKAAIERQYSPLPAALADEVDVDYTSVAGGQPSRVAADALVAGGEKGLGAYAATKHNFSDVVVTVTGDRATAIFTGQATHVKPDGPRWSCGGDYTYAFARTAAGWRATAAKFEMRWELGQR